MFIKHLLNDWQCAGDITGFSVRKSRKLGTEIPILNMKQVKFQEVLKRLGPRYKSTPLIQSSLCSMYTYFHQATALPVK